MRPPASDLSTLGVASGAADELLAVSTTAVPLVGPFTGKTTHVLVSVGPQPVRVTFDGSAPTASNGHYWPAGQQAVLNRSLATAARFIRQGATDSDIHATPLVVG
jgi:hypothetical protein